MKKRIWNILVAFSILLSSIFFATYKRTFSSTLGEYEKTNIYAERFCDLLDIVLNERDHCKNEYNDYLNEMENCK